MPQDPGYVDEASSGIPPIRGVDTSLTVFIGTCEAGPLAEPTELWSVQQFQHVFGALDSPLGLALSQYFVNGGSRAIVLRVPGPCSEQGLVGGLSGLDLIDYFGLLSIPETASLPELEARAVAGAALAACQQRRSFYLLDAPRSLAVDAVADWADSLEASSFGAIFFPSLRMETPLRPGEQHVVGPAASVAGVYARNDQQRGVWKAAAGLEATVRGAHLERELTDAENGPLNQRRINVLRRFPSGVTVWGARTLRGADANADDFKYVPVRRLACFIEESLLRGTRWTVFERNDPDLWARVRLQVGSFLHVLFRDGAFQGRARHEAYFLRCDESTTSPADIIEGRITLLLGFAPLKPAEFVTLSLALSAAPS